MLSMNYVGEATTYSVEFQYVNKNRVKLYGNFPAKKKGFILTRIGDPRAFRGDYTEYNTIYREYDDSVEFSNNNEVYNPYRTVTFYTNVGGTIEGELKQEVKDYSELVIPTPSANEDYVFDHWSPSIPTSGEILHDTRYTAVFKKVILDVAFTTTEGGTLEGELNQKAKDYSELTIPTPIASDDYAFSHWMPEIPTEGPINYDQVFTAVFVSTLPTLEERVAVAEQNIAQNTSDIIDTQNALCELSMLSE